LQDFLSSVSGQILRSQKEMTAFNGRVSLGSCIKTRLLGILPKQKTLADKEGLQKHCDRFQHIADLHLM